MSDSQPLGSVTSESKILIVGYGSAGRRHARNLGALGCRHLLFLRSGRPNTMDDLPPGEVVTTLAQALDREPLAAVIATPTALHLQTALPLAAEGCHLLIEKPLASDRELAACTELVHLARQRKLVTMVGYQFRFHPMLRELRAGLQEGRLGELIGARAEWGEYLPEWHPWEDYRESYAARADLGGGVLLTLSHPIDYLAWLFGDIVEAQAACQKVPLISTRVVDDWAELILRFRGGLIAQVHLDYVQQPPVHRLSVWGHRGRADLDFHTSILTWMMRDETTQQVSADRRFTRNDMFLAEMRHFLDALASQRATDIPLEDGVAVLRAVARARHNAALQQIQQSPCEISVGIP